MGTELATIEPIALPDLAKGKIPSLPAWLATQRAALGTNLQTVAGKFKEVRTIPAALLPNAAQRDAIEANIRSLNSSFNRTPENSREAAIEALAAVTRLLLVLAGGKSSENVADAKADAYMESLDDVPSWAVSAAVKRWFKGDCGTDEKGQPYDYKWAPDPATLRKLAMHQFWMVKVRVADLQDVLDAQVYVDCSAELERGTLAWHTVLKAIKSGTAESLAGMSIDDAAAAARAELDAKPSETPNPEAQS